VKKLAPDSGGRVESITDAAVEKLLSYHWPGNVRELENVIERSLVMVRGHATGRRRHQARKRAGRGALWARRPASVKRGALSARGSVARPYEQEIIREALRRADGNKSQAARMLGLTRNALRYRLTQMGLEA